MYASASIHENIFIFAKSFFTLQSLIFVVFINSATAQNNDELTEEVISTTLVDSSHEFIKTRSNNLISWIDNFFGDPRSDLESPQSFLRLRLEHESDAKYASSFRQRLRGKVVLPRINERIGLIFSDEQDDEISDKNALPQTNFENKTNNIALQYTSIDGEHSRLDFRVGLQSSLQLKLVARYRYEQSLSKQVNLRISEALYFRDGEGIGEKTVLDLDYAVDENEVLRWSTHAKFGQETDGVEWGSSLVWSYRINEKSALSYFVNITGNTRPDFTNHAYGLGAIFRRHWFREWLFFELEPAYQWRRERVELAGQTIGFKEREGAAQFIARIEIHFVTN